MTVKATREGLSGQKTASGYVIDSVVAFVALPCRRALHRHLRVRNPANGRTAIAEVLDVGPWNEFDADYVFGGSRPQAESGVSISGKGTNRAGIDLGGYVWHALGMEDNSDVDWEFLEL
jgi:hypothetical protein